MQVPCVTLYGNVLWFVDEFLSQKLVHLAKTLDKKTISSVMESRVSWLTQKMQALVK
jgi:hypothetical protein